MGTYYYLLLLTTYYLLLTTYYLLLTTHHLLLTTHYSLLVLYVPVYLYNCTCIRTIPSTRAAVSQQQKHTGVQVCTIPVYRYTRLAFPLQLCSKRTVTTMHIQLCSHGENSHAGNSTTCTPVYLYNCCCIPLVLEVCS